MRPETANEDRRTDMMLTLLYCSLIFKDARARYAVFKGRRTRDLCSRRADASASVTGVNTQQNGPGAIAAVSKKATPEGAPSQQSSESTMLGDSGVPERGYQPKPVAEISGVEY